MSRVLSIKACKCAPVRAGGFRAVGLSHRAGILSVTRLIGIGSTRFSELAIPILGHIRYLRGSGPVPVNPRNPAAGQGFALDNRRGPSLDSSRTGYGSEVPAPSRRTIL